MTAQRKLRRRHHRHNIVEYEQELEQTKQSVTEFRPTRSARLRDFIGRHIGQTESLTACLEQDVWMG